MKIDSRENYLRALEFRGPEWVPFVYSAQAVVWQEHGQALERILLRHPRVLEDYREGDWKALAMERSYQEPGSFVDDWGCLWQVARPGVLGQVIGHPLADWSAFATYRAPDPDEQVDWEQRQKHIEDLRRNHRLTTAHYDVVQGGFFDRLQFLRGLDNLLVDLLTEPPQLASLIDMVLDYNRKCIRRWLEIGVDQFYFHGDIGTQRALMMSPAAFRKHLKPAYEEMFLPCRRAGAHVWYSSDGRLLEIVDDLVECGVTLHDPQVRANTLEGIARAYCNRLCAMVDIDQQMLPFCSPAEIDEQVRRAVEMVGTKSGGLILFAEPSGDVPLENVEAIFTAWERYGT